MNKYFAIGAGLLLIASHTAVYFKGRHDVAVETELAHKTEVLQAVSDARAEEQAKQEAADARINTLETVRRGIQSRLDAALASLRNRPERADKESRAHCQGATGAELSRPDGQFLRGEAARADRIRAALATCYEHADAVAQ